MNLACPDCNTVYRIDPARVPENGAHTRCRECGTQFRVERGETAPGVARMAERVEVAAGAEAQAAPEPSSAEAPDTPPPSAPQREQPGAADAAGAPTEPRAPAFGPQDPDTRAQRLARALVSDIVVYNRDRWEQSRDQGSLRTDFRDEVLKSWEEYVEQVGEDMAKGTPYFREALNAILAEGKRVF